MKFFIVVLAAIAANLGLVNACAFSRQCCSDLTHEVHVMRDDIRGIGKNVAMLVSGRTAATRPNTATEATEATSITEASETTVPARTEATTVQGCRGVIFDGRCFFPLDDKYTFERSKTACRNLSATFAPIVSIGAYDTVLGYLQKKLLEEERSNGLFRLAMLYDPDQGGNDMTTLGGTRVTYDKWVSTYPSITSNAPWLSSFTTVVWQVASDPVATQGLYNRPPTETYHPICMTSI